MCDSPQLHLDDVVEFGAVTMRTDMRLDQGLLHVGGLDPSVSPGADVFPTLTSLRGGISDIYVNEEYVSSFIPNHRSRLYSSFFFIFHWHFRYQLLNILKTKRAINQQDFKIVDLHFVQSEQFLLTWSCGSRERDTTLSEWKFQLNSLVVNPYSAGKVYPRTLTVKIFLMAVDP